MKRKTALITGVTGQDGSYLAELLLAMGYEVHGVVRRSSSFNTSRLRNLLSSTGGREDQYISRFQLHYGDITDAQSIASLIHTIRPTECYNLAGQSHVKISFEMPSYTGEATGLATTSILEAIRQHSPETRFYQASSSEMFGSSPAPQSEETIFHPRSPYGAAKLYSHWITVNYREAYGLHATSGILFNHESPRRGMNFVTRKIAKAAVEISMGVRDRLPLGNLDAQRDWGYAPEYVGGMWAMLNQESPEDYVLATGKAATVQQFADACFGELSLDASDYVEFDSSQIRPAEVDSLIGVSTRARTRLGWEPTIDVSQLANLMIKAEIDAFQTKGQSIDRPSSWGLSELEGLLTMH